jgi:hypothetical protein
MQNLISVLKDWFGQEELIGRVLAKIGPEKSSEILEVLAEEEGLNNNITKNQNTNED